MTSIQKRDLVLGLIVFTLSLVVLFGILPWAVKTPRVVPNLALSPTFWPRIILVSLAALGAMLALRALRDGMTQDRAQTDDTGEAGEPVTDEGRPFDLSDLRVLFVVGLMVAFCALLEPFGVVLPAVVLLFGLVLVHERERWRTALAVSVGTVVVLYLFFRHVDQIPVPLGPLNALF